MSETFPQSEFREALGVCTSVFGHRNSLTAGKLRLLAETGIPWVEIAALQPQHLNVFDDERVDELAAAVSALSLGVWSLHTPFCGLAMDDAETRTDAVRRLVRAGRAAERFGAGVVVVHPGRDVPSRNRGREVAWTREGLARALEALPEGMTVAMETMGRESIGGPAEEMLAIVEGYDPARVGVCLDTGHVHTGGDPAEYAQAVAGRIVSVHLHDNAGDRDAHALPGEGTIDWPACLGAIRAAGYSGPWISEAGLATLSPIETVREFVRRMAALPA